MSAQPAEAPTRVGLGSPRARVGLGLAGVILVSATVRFLLSLNVPAPWIFVDELIYSELGRSAWSGFSIRGVPVDGYGPVYPAVIAPAYALFENLVHAYVAVKAINAVVMSLVAIPVYFTARFVVDARWALAAAALAVVVPGMAYTSVVMTESAFYPAFALSGYLAVRALVHRGWIAQILVFASCALCFEIRPQGVVIAPAFIVAVAALTLSETLRADSGQRRAALRAELVGFIPTWIVAAAGVVGALLYPTVTGQPLRSLLGAYSIAAEQTSPYDPRVIAVWVLHHVAETSLWLGIVPVFALLVMAGAAWMREGTRAERAFVAAAITLIVSTTVIVSAFVVFSNVGRIEERNLFYVGVFFLIALCWWASQARVAWLPGWAVPLIVAAAGLPLLVPLDRFLNLSAVSDTFGLFLPWAVALRMGDAAFAEGALLLLGIGAGVCVAVLRPRSGVAVVTIVVLFLVLSGIAVDRRTDRASADTRAGAISLDRDWVDQTVGSGTDVTAVYPGNTEPLRLWELEFFNRSVRGVLTIGAPLAGNLPETVVNLAPDGRVVTREGLPLDADVALVDAFSPVLGEVLREDPEHRMQLVRVEQPLRVEQSMAGLFADGWSGAEFSYTRYACAGGSASFALASDPELHSGPVAVTAYVGDVPGPQVDLPPSLDVVRLDVPLTAMDGVCGVRLLVSSTAVPRDVSGAPDTRSLGVRVTDVEYRPGTA